MLIRFGHLAGGAAIGLALVALGTLAALTGYRRYRRADRAIRTGTVPTTGRGPGLLVSGVVLLSVALIVVYLVAG